MQFFESFYSLGYSGIVLLITFFFVTALLYSSLGLHKRGILAKSFLMIVMIAVFVMTTNYLASERQIMMDAIRDEGGLKRTQER
ncbi:MAG: hypothetical protein ACR2O8_05175 [Rhizobiaceae bacterium]